MHAFLTVKNALLVQDVQQFWKASYSFIISFRYFFILVTVQTLFSAFLILFILY